MNLALYILFVFIGLLLLQEVFRCFPKLTLAVFIILPILLIPRWINNGISDWFLWAKLLALIVSLTWLSMLKLTNIGEKRTAKIIVYVLFSINILEAVTRGILGGGMANYFNAIAGILLIATLDKVDSISVTKDNYKDVIWNKMTLMWIIGYTIWNWTFVYLNMAYISAHLYCCSWGSIGCSFF